MSKRINLINCQFNQLIVIEETEKRDTKGSILWKCKCSCGNETLATSTELKSGHKKSCGCLQKQIASKLGQNNLIDITGQKFGKLLVLKKITSKKISNGSTQIFWLCKCDCGNNYIARGNALKTGNTQSCGCIKSLGEQKIASILNEYGIPFEREKTFNGSLYRYDFFVNSQYIIEYDGKQHFEDFSWGHEYYSKERSQKRDLEKNQFCYNLNIPIIRIPYTHFSHLIIDDLLLETSKFKVMDMKIL